MMVVDERGFVKRWKQAVSPTIFRVLTIVFNIGVRAIPFRLRYALFSPIVRRRAPYRFVRPDDTVVQIGSARDILAAGRSRALHLARCASAGRIIAIEADPMNCMALRRVLKRYEIRNITLIESGAWSSKGTLTFLSSRRHPAANLLKGIKDAPRDIRIKRQYEECVVDVDTVDSLLSTLEIGAVRLVSVTTNGAELEILEGMTETLRRCDFVSLASTTSGLDDRMEELGFSYVARDDRGFCFKRNNNV